MLKNASQTICKTYYIFEIPMIKKIVYKLLLPLLLFTLANSVQAQNLIDYGYINFYPNELIHSSFQDLKSGNKQFNSG